MGSFDVVVIGGGHAGVEAAAAAARRGAHTALVTQRVATIGAMSCNPSIGGVGKGHIVREIDALDGIMARAADTAAIHHRMLNASKGVAVHGPRVQADRRLYALAVREALAGLPTLSLIDAEIGHLWIDRGRAAGVELSGGGRIAARAVVLATGTFLGGRLFRGEETEDGGRLGDRPATRLAEQLRGEGWAVGRLKTGTPPRLDGRTIDWARLTPQPSDVGDWTVSSMTRHRLRPQVACAITRTNAATHDVIRAGLASSPLRGGTIIGRGPRYCPSIEDKIVRFGDRDAHQLFLEPEGLDSPLVYPNGISTSLSPDAQVAMVRTIAGLERARLVTPGYAVEYDFLDPRDLDRGLQSRRWPGLYCAGQINGTTGYEEAAGQGVVAGLNAAATALGRDQIRLDRATSYIGVMLDDLVLQGVTEPYRMLTARAEYRLSLRADNAETRLAAIAAAAGCWSEERRVHHEARQVRRGSLTEQLHRRGGDGDTLADRVRRGEEVADELDGPADLIAEITATARYAPYVERQAAEVERCRLDEAIALPPDLDYARIAGLSREMVERLGTSRPDTLAAASRIRGVTPAALAAVLLHARRKAA